jgi:penicillin-binding protein 1A
MEPTIHDLERREQRGRRFPAVAILAAIGLISATWLGLFSFLGSNAAFGTIQDLQQRYICPTDSLDLDFPDLSRLSEVYTADGVLLGKLTERNSQPVPIDEVPELVVAALLSAEDADFYEHEGIDFKAIARAAIQDARGGSRQGGSTITQQVVKQNFISDDVTLERKICEAVIAAELERRYTKDQILEYYMNSVFFGANAYGVKAAAQEYFGKDLDRLTAAEAAAMMTPIRNPTVYDPRDEPANVLRARDAVLVQMERNGYLTPDEAAAAADEPLVTVPHQEFAEISPQVIIAARDAALNDSRYGLGETFADRKQALFGCPAADDECAGGGGLKITVTVEQRLQDEARRILQAWFRPGVEGPTGAIAMVDNATGAVKVMAGGLDFGTDIEAGERPYDLASKGRRQAGSAFKPFALMAALESGSAQGGWPITLGSWWDATSPQQIDCGFPCSKDGNIWTVSNAGGGGSGIRSLEEATYQSTNTVFAQVSLAVGPDKIVEMAHRLGIESALNPVLSIALGTNSVSPLEMASAYSTIANHGARHEQYLIERIEDAAGNVIYQHQTTTDQVTDPAMTAAVVDTLQKVVSQGTATRADIGRPQAGKTGTTQDFNDVWFIGFIPQYTASVWVGYPDASVDMVDFTVWDDLNGREQFYQRAYGGTLAAPIWKQFMTYVTEGLPVLDFPPDPPGTAVYFQTPVNEVPDLAGLTEAEATDVVYKAGFTVAVEQVASIEPVGTIVEQEPAAGERLTQGQTVIVRISNGELPIAPLITLNGAPADAVEGLLATFTVDTGVRVNWVRVDQETPDVTLHGRVIFTSPAAGQPVTDGETVTVYVGVPPPDPDVND